GNDGSAGPTFGSIAGPAGASGALAVGATYSRAELARVRVVLRRGLDVILDQKLPLLGPVAPSHSLSLQVATPRSTRGVAGSQSVDYFDAKGFSRVAGRAVVVPVGADPQAAAIAASRAGAAAIVAGAAALLAQMRPSLDGPSLDSLLVGYAQQGDAPAMSAGAGTLRLGASAVGEVAAQPTTLGFGIWQGARWHATRTLVV